VGVTLAAVSETIYFRHLSFLFDQSIFGASFSLIVAGAVASTTAASRLLNGRAFVHLGLISYSLYLWQQMFTLTPFWIFKNPVIGVISALAAAELSYRSLEVPFVPVRRRLFSRRLAIGVPGHATPSA